MRDRLVHSLVDTVIRFLVEMDPPVSAHGLYGSVTAATVLDDDFEVWTGLGQDTVKGLIQFGAGVQAYYDNAEFHMLLLFFYKISVASAEGRNATRACFSTMRSCRRA